MNNRIRAIRNKADLTQEEFAKRLGLSRQYIALCETGDREPSARTIKDICREFNVREEWLRFGTGEPFGGSNREEDLSLEIGKLFQSRPDSFKRATITALMKFDPDGEEWNVLERIYHGIETEIKKEE